MRSVADQPPTHPDAWAAHDRAFATPIRLSVGMRASEQGDMPCACGGTWRDVLLPHAKHPLWRCLHCGGLHHGDHLLAAGPAPSGG